MGKTNSSKEELRGHLRDYVNSITRPDRRSGKDMYVCPLCKSGFKSGAGHDGAFKVTPDGKGWNCFSCGRKGDLFTLIGEYEGLQDFKDQIRRAEELYGSVEASINTNTLKRKDSYHMTSNTQIQAQTPSKESVVNYIDECRKTFPESPGETYLRRRGVPEDYAKKFHIGYDKSRSAVVIPYDKDGSYYITRRVDDKQYRKPKTDIAGQEPLYNGNALYIGKPCFVTEGPIDAISIMVAAENSAAAVAVGGTGVTKLIEACRKKKPALPLILSFDNDEAGQKACQSAAGGLTEIGVPFIVAEYSYDKYPEGRRKDCNDLLTSDKRLFVEDLKENIRRHALVANERDADLVKKHNSVRADVLSASFRRRLMAGIGVDYIPTGLKDLDRILGGGLYPGLYIIGAMSSMGKTTILEQIAGNIASQGHDVLYFSLEMGQESLQSRDISRETYKISLIRGNMKFAKTSREIKTVRFYDNYTDEEKDVIWKAFDAYDKYNTHIYYYEGIGDMDVIQFRKELEIHKRLTGKAPLLCVDYLQIIDPMESDERATEKRIIDHNMTELKRISKDFSIPVVVLSSFNRENYYLSTSMSAYKSSGGIEYSADCLLAMEPAGLDDDAGKEANQKVVEECKSSPERNLVIKILKQRDGEATASINVTYHAAYNYFEDSDFSMPTRSRRSKRSSSQANTESSFASLGTENDNKRQRERDLISKAYDDVVSELDGFFDRDVTLYSIAEKTDMTVGTVVRKIEEYGGYRIEENVVIRDENVLPKGVHVKNGDNNQEVPLNAMNT